MTNVAFLILAIPMLLMLWMLRRKLMRNQTGQQKNRRRKGLVPYSLEFNSNAFDALERRLGNIMEALADPTTHSVGVYSLDDGSKDTMLQKVKRRIRRDNMFDRLLTATVSNKPNVKKIQDELARQLELKLDEKSKDNRRANELFHRIKQEYKILIVLCDIYNGLDLNKVGIPYGADHSWCKILLTSTNKDVLSNHMHTQINFSLP